MTCQHCGAVHSEAAERCCFCDTRFEASFSDEPPAGHDLHASGSVSASHNIMTPTHGALAMQPVAQQRPEAPARPATEQGRAEQTEWKSEVRERLRAYRVSHGITVDDLQAALPFEPVIEHEEELSVSAAPATRELSRDLAKTAASRRPPEPPEDDRVEISIPSHEGMSIGVYHPTVPERASRLDAIFPVASLPERRRAAAIDGVLILLSFGAMLSIFWALGGRLGWNKVDAIVTGVTLGLFYAQYFALFTLLGACTPGMMLRGLRVVSFDGGAPTSRQMLWRSFGYLVSAGTCLLGFLWALWDEDHLCWHDRISQTYLTSAEEPGSESSSPQ